MKTITKLSLVMLMVFSTTLVFSQALITYDEDTDPIDTRAMFEIRVDPSSPAGLLIPKVDLSLSSGEAILDGMDTPADGLIVYNEGTYVDKGLWYYDGDVNEWVIFSNYTSVYALDPGNFGELFQWEPIGTSVEYTITNSYWTPWNSAMPPDQLGANFIEYSLTAPEVLPDYPTNGQACTGLEVIADGDGKYQVNITATIEAISSGVDLIGVLAVNGDLQQKVNFRFNFQTSNDVASLTAGGIITLAEGDVIDFRFKSASALETIGIIGFNMSLTKISGITAP